MTRWSLGELEKRKKKQGSRKYTFDIKASVPINHAMFDCQTFFFVVVASSHNTFLNTHMKGSSRGL